MIQRNTNKYNSSATYVNDIRFASKVEAKRYEWLLESLTEESLSTLVCHPRLNLIINDIRVGAYVGDFSYTQNGEHIVEDVKGGLSTELYRFKKRCVFACHGITIQEVRFKRKEWHTT